jgi:hypothetical protein
MSLSPDIWAGWEEVVYMREKSMALFMTGLTGTGAGMAVENMACPEGECVVM